MATGWRQRYSGESREPPGGPSSRSSALRESWPGNGTQMGFTDQLILKTHISTVFPPQPLHQSCSPRTFRVRGRTAGSAPASHSMEDCCSGWKRRLKKELLGCACEDQLISGCFVWLHRSCASLSSSQTTRRQPSENQPSGLRLHTLNGLQGQKAPLMNTCLKKRWALFCPPPGGDHRSPLHPSSVESFY